MNQESSKRITAPFPLIWTVPQSEFGPPRTEGKHCHPFLVAMENAFWHVEGSGEPVLRMLNFSHSELDRDLA